MPNKSIFHSFVFFVFLLLSFSSCSTTKLTLQQTDNELGIVQYKQPQPYIAQPENTLVQKENRNTITSQNEIQHKERKHNFADRKQTGKKLNATAKKSIQKLKKLAPDSRTIIQSASKEWKPRNENFSLTWKDVVFVIVLLGLLLLLGGILHNLVGLSFVITFVIAISLAFLVMCIYIWYLHNN